MSLGEALLYGAAAAGLVGVLMLVCRKAFSYHLVSDRLYRHTLALSAVLWTIPWVFRRVRSLFKRPTESAVRTPYRWFVVFFLSGGIAIAWMVLSVPAILLNCRPDRSPAFSHRLRVVNSCSASGSYGSRYYYVVVDSWVHPGRTEQIAISRSLYRRQQSGKVVLRISAKKGVLGYPWIPEGGIEIDDR